MKNFKKWAFTGLLLIVVSTVFSQGSTNSSINGKISEAKGESLIGASLVAVHTPSGTKYSASTDVDGFFRISNMRVGGPYEITASYIGFKTKVISDVFLQLGESQNLSIALETELNQLEEVVIVQDNAFNSKKTGAQTIIDSRKLNALPSLSRNIADFARLTPQVQIRGDDVISIGGQNNRYNAIYIDGAVNNDVFGLASNGTNGGQTGVSPISLDAIDQVQVSVAPFDVKLSGFAGGAISAITKSGTNKFEGSAYFFNRDETLAGKTPVSIANGGERKKLGDFTARTYGVRAGGAIKKDKLFYFINYERQDNETPQPFDINNYVGGIGFATGSTVYDGALAATKIQQLQDYLSTAFGYKTGDYRNNLSTLVSDKLIAKIDWNINDKNKLAVKHSYVSARNVSPFGSTRSSINFENGAQDFKSTTNSTSLELNTRFNNKYSNNLVLGYTNVVDDRDANGDPFPSISIQDGAGSIFIGSESNSTANLLEQDILTLTDNFEINTGRHNITIGTHNEFSSAKNVFFQRNYGEYRYSNFNSFLTNGKPNRFRINYSLIGGTGDESLGAAEFDVMQFGGYIQDEFKVANNLKLTFGIRVDVPVWEDGLVNDDFNNRTIGLLEAAGKKLQGAKVGQKIDNYAHLSPRLGFNYDLNGNRKTQFRGGLGIFTSRLPLVWPGGTYNNNGLTQGAVQITGTTNVNMPTFNPNPSVQSQISTLPATIAPVPGSGATGGNIDIFAKDFRLPQVFKASFAVDQKLPYGILFSADITYNDNISGIRYENLNLSEPTVFTTGADVRPRYSTTRVDSKYLGIFLASNTSEGEAWNTSFTLSKNFKSSFADLNLSGTYAYGNSTVLYDATSSVNASQWNNIETVNGSNKVSGTSMSDFSQGHRVLGNSFVTLKWTKNTKSKFGFFYEGAQGTPVSYVYNDFGNILRDTFSNSALIYVPAKQSDIVLVADASTGLTPQQQWDALNSYIENNEYLSSRRGQYAERNGSRLNWSHIVDFKFAQEFSINVGKSKHALEISADIFNFTNLINKDWGRRYFATNDQVLLINQVGFLADNTTPTFNFKPAAGETLNQVDDAGLQSSRWQMQVGVRYTFN